MPWKETKQYSQGKKTNFVKKLKIYNRLVGDECKLALGER